MILDDSHCDHWHNINDAARLRQKVQVYHSFFSDIL